MTVSEESPYEILCKIFQLLCREPISLHVLQNTSKYNLTEFPWAAGLVCKRWRAAFLSYPRLWTSLYLRDHYPFTDSYVAEMNRRTAIYVERSEELPLSIVVQLVGSNASLEVPSTWRILLSLSHRWKSVELMADHTPCKSFACDLRKCRGEMPILESLKVSTRRGAKLPLDGFQIAPRLTHVTLSYLYGINAELLPLGQLKRITIQAKLDDWSEGRRIHSILPALRNVEELRIISFPYDGAVSEVVPIHFDRLRALQLSHPDILPWIEAPSMERLHVEDRPYCTNKESDYSEKILHFVQRSSCYIRYLTLQGCDVSTALSVMEILTHVNELSIIDPSVDLICAMIKAIAKFNLRVLEVTCYSRNVTKAIVDAISALLETWNSGSRIMPLQRITVVSKRLLPGYGEQWFVLNDIQELSWPSFVAAEVVHSISGSSQPSVTINIVPARRHMLASPNSMQEEP